MLCYMVICTALLTEAYSEALSVFKLRSYGVQEESHSRVQDPLQQRLGSGIEKYGTKVQ